MRGWIQHPEKYKAFLADCAKQWLEDAHQQLLEFMAKPKPACKVFVPAPAPIPELRPQAGPTISALPQPGHDGDDLGYIHRYIDEATEVKECGAKDFVNESETFEDIHARAVEWAELPRTIV